MPETGLERREITGRVLCLAVAASCVCGLEAGHDGPHECHERAVCNGSWSGEPDSDTFRIHRMPKGGIFGELLDVLGFGSLLGDDDDA